MAAGASSTTRLALAARPTGPSSLKSRTAGCLAEGRAGPVRAATTPSTPQDNGPSQNDGDDKNDVSIDDLLPDACILRGDPREFFETTRAQVPGRMTRCALAARPKGPTSLKDRTAGRSTVGLPGPTHAATAPSTPQDDGFGQYDGDKKCDGNTNDLQLYKTDTWEDLQLLLDGFTARHAQTTAAIKETLGNRTSQP